MALKSKTSVQELLDFIQSSHDEAFLYISQGLSYQEQNQFDLALDKYNKGLLKINKALEIRCDRPYCVGSEWERARKMQHKMRKIVHMTNDQLTYLSKVYGADVLPPSYDEACRTDKFCDSRRASCPSTSNQNDLGKANLKTAISEFMVSKNESIGSSVSEAIEIFFISEGVQLFSVTGANSVSILSASSALHVYKFVDSRPQAAATAEKLLPTGWLQVGNWTYPLVPGQSPALESGYGAFLFPDVTKQDGTVAALIFSENVDLDTRKTFKAILDEMTVLEKEDSAVLHGESFSDTLSRGIVTGAEYLSAGVSKGAAVTGQYIHKGAAMLKQRISPDSRPYEIDPKLQKAIEVAKGASSVAVTVSSYLAGKLGEFTMVVGNKVAPHIREQGAKLLSKALDKDPEEAKETMNSVFKVAAGGFQGFSTMYMGLQNAAMMLAVSLSNETVDIVDYKYGHGAGEAVGNAVTAVGNLALATHNVKSLGMKSIAKRTAKDAGKAVLLDYLDKNQEKQTQTEARPSGEPLTEKDPKGAKEQLL